MVKLGFKGLCIFFLILLLNIDCRYSLESCTLNLCFEQKKEENVNKKNCSVLYRRVIVNMFE